MNMLLARIMVHRQTTRIRPLAARPYCQIDEYRVLVLLEFVTDCRFTLGALHARASGYKLSRLRVFALVSVLESPVISVTRREPGGPQFVIGMENWILQVTSCIERIVSGGTVYPDRSAAQCVPKDSSGRKFTVGSGGLISELRIPL